MHRLVLFIAVALATLAAPALAGPAPTTLNSVADPIENELLVRSIRLGLTRDRSSKPEDAGRFVCVRDRYPGSRRVRLRCATNHDWQVAASTSVSRAMIGANQPYLAWDASLGRVTQHANPGGNATATFNTGVLDISPNLLADPIGKDDSEQANLARILELRAMLVVSKLPDAAATPPQDVVRFAAAFEEVRAAGSDETRAANAVQASGLGIERYNALVTRLERDEDFRTRVRAALQSLQAPLTL
jgi:hypothetical protein